jgi:hypothetical protein
VASVAVTALFVLVGLHATPSRTTASSSSPSAVASSDAGAAVAQPGGGADADVPVKVKRSAGARSTTEPVQQSATKNESLTVAASQPGTASPSAPAQSGVTRIPVSTSPSTSTPSSSSTPSPTGTLVVAPDQLSLGTGSTGQLTLTAQGGPVSWSASTSSALMLSSSQGTLQAGQSATLVVTVNPGGRAAGSAFVTIDSAPVNGAAVADPAATPSASEAIEVTWTTRHTRPARPSPLPSSLNGPVPSGSASPSSSPSASPSS